MPAPLSPLVPYSIRGPPVYLKYPVVEYQISLEIREICVIGDEQSVDKAYPLHIPHIRLTAPSLLFLAFSENQLPSCLPSFSFDAFERVFRALSLGKWSGINRGEERIMFIYSNRRDDYVFRLEIPSLFVHLSFGSIFAFMQSIRDLTSLVKRGLFMQSIKQIKSYRAELKAAKGSSAASVPQPSNVGIFKKV